MKKIISLLGLCLFLYAIPVQAQNQLYYWHGTAYIQPANENHQAIVNVPTGPSNCCVQVKLFWTCSGPGGSMGDNEQIWGGLSGTDNGYLEIFESDVRNDAQNPPLEQYFYDVDLSGSPYIKIVHEDYNGGDAHFFWTATYEVSIWGSYNSGGE